MQQGTTKPQDERRKPMELTLSPESPKLNIGVETAQGKNPEKTANEDRATTGDGFFVVCDGMGGPKRGNEAAEIAVNKIVEEVKTLQYNLQRREVTVTPNNIRSRLRVPFKHTHQAIQRKLNPPGTPKARMAGTTATFGFFLESTEGEKDVILVLANIGDSPVGIFDTETKTLTQVTNSHIAPLVKAYPDKKEARIVQDRLARSKNPKEDFGKDSADYKIFANSNVISASLGQEGSYKADKVSTRIIKMEPHYRVVAWTDGIETLTSGEMEAILASEKNNKKAAKKLVKAASSRDIANNPRRNLDDKTVVVLSLK